jgi:hypothetical protein
MSIIAPLYVAAGFALYLTRRSQLEAWDLELGLRQLAQRHQPKPGLRGNLLIASLSLLLFGLSLPDVSKAMELGREDAQTLIQEVLEEEAFGKEIEHHYWKYIGDKGDSPEQDESAFIKWLEEMAGSFALVGEFLMWILVAGVVAYLFYWYMQNKPTLGNSFFRRRNRKESPHVVAGFDLRPESLPEVPAQVAAKLIQQGDLRGGLALLYRATLSALVHRYDLPIHEGDTEGECLIRSRHIGQPALEAYFSELTGAWQRLAYAHQQPEKDRLLALCQAWHDHLEVSHEA